MKPLEDPWLERCTKQVHGALINGYNDENISTKFEQQIKETEALSIEWTNLLEEIGVDSSISKELFKELLDDIL